MTELVSGYQFKAQSELALMRQRLLGLGRQLDLLGTVLLAPEGINLSLGGESEALDRYLGQLSADYGLGKLVMHRQPVTAVPFLRLKVRIRSEIIAFEPELDPGQVKTGEALGPKEWHDLLAGEQVQLVDARNDYEYRIGSFKGAANPEIERFTEFADWARENLEPDRPVAMFCTGGVRCEKASARLLADGFSEVYHLRGGILKYLETFQNQSSRWEGECFVFDDRVSVDHSLQPSDRPVCAGCRHPHAALPSSGMPPVSDQGECSLCQRRFDSARLAGIRERVRQIALARQRGQTHLGPQSATATDYEPKQP